MSDTPDLGPVPQRITIETDVARHLVANQFPEWADLPVEPVANGGWDNWTFHLGSQMSVRMPSAAEYALAVDKEHRWLPELASQLPLPIPVPLAIGRPGSGYPYSWSIYPWLDGSQSNPNDIVDPIRFAVDLAEFLVALQRVDPTDGPGPGLHNWYRGGTLRTYQPEVDRSLTALDSHLDVELAREIWKTALDAPWNGKPTWFHGDVARGNLLLDDGQLAAVIDFGTCGVGDPACDLAIAWTLLTTEGSEAFRERLSVDDATWARGRGWALWKTLATYSWCYDDPDDEDAVTAKRILDGLFAEYATSRR
ncbi:aminoglycoside phosphotransferase family protein [Hamadaea sp. NPDC051192]|uniref:aminoglycoside phosphotransferase family protein n=1 Tax=Hamadaea sp. NPDC051192 TaxID=3154940 RepID=UPI0034464555